MIDLSVVIPTCNRNDSLEECLERLAPKNQINDGFTYEVIVTDDGKVKPAKDLIKEKYLWAQWTAGPAKGPASNRNNGAAKATGRWLVFLDDDCLPDLDLLANYYKVIAKDKDIKIIEGAIYSDEKIKPLFFAPVNLTGGHLWSCNFAISMDVFKEVNGFDKNYKYPHMEDVDLNKRLKASGHKMLFDQKARVYHAPRPIASTKKLALYHESWLYYHSKFGDRKTLADLMINICRVRLTLIKKGPKGLSSFKAMASLFTELFYTLKFSRKWDIK